ncbi:MAG: hypothetical protein H6721_13660 [Sandaracinus sp.]|nr:hypothetical protein [Sandaracinus sp.]
MVRFWTGSAQRTLVVLVGSVGTLAAVLGGWAQWVLTYRPPHDMPGLILPALAVYAASALLVLATALHAIVLARVEPELRRRCLPSAALVLPAMGAAFLGFVMFVDAASVLAYGLAALASLGQVLAALFWRPAR